MIVQHTPAGVVVWTPAKLNLFLEVQCRRADGYHEIETIMVPVGLFDTLRFERAVDGAGNGRIEFSCEVVAPHDPTQPADDWAIPADGENLVVKAVELLRATAGEERGARIHLTKRIPPAAGFGGGSSDASAALVAGNLAWNLGLSRERLHELAARLGSDVPFFLQQHAAVCRGRGEMIQPLQGGAKLHFVVVRPPVGLSTAEVYRGCIPADRTGDCRTADRLIAALGTGDPRNLAAGLYNRLQPAAERLLPWIGKLSRWFTELNLIGQQMSGSGSGYFGVCYTASQARRAAAVLSSRGAGSVFAVKGL